MFGIQKTGPDLIQSDSSDERQEIQRVLHMRYEVCGEGVRLRTTRFVALLNDVSMEAEEHDIAVVFGEDVITSFGDVLVMSHPFCFMTSKFLVVFAVT